MESILFTVIIAIAMSAIQAAIKKNKKQEDQNVEAAAKKAQPIVKAVKVSNAAMGSKTAAKSTSTIQKPKQSQKNPPSEHWSSTEGIQTEALENIVILEQKNVSAVEENHGVLQSITFDDLQRSIVMAEILGKPKALQRKFR